MRTALATIVIIMGFRAVVNASAPKTLDDLIKEATARGEATAAYADDARLAGIPEGTPGKGLEVLADQTTDDMTHDFVVFFHQEKPLGIMFTTMHLNQRTEEFLNLSCDPKGHLKQCYRQAGLDDEKGQPIPGSEKEKTPVSPKDRAMTTALRHELDFWLKGKYRKIAAKP